jgi:hypothetical protein
MYFFREVMSDDFDKTGLGYIWGDFFTHSSGRPVDKSGCIACIAELNSSSNCCHQSLECP